MIMATIGAIKAKGRHLRPLSAPFCLLSSSTVTKISHFLVKTYLHGFWKFLLRFEDNVASEKSELVQINFLIGPVLGSG